jgi:hypothetical protein
MYDDDTNPNGPIEFKILYVLAIDGQHTVRLHAGATPTTRLAFRLTLMTDNKCFLNKIRQPRQIDRMLISPPYCRAIW